MLFILFMKHVIGANEITQGLFTLLYFLAGIVGMPLWIWLSRRHSKHRIWCVAMVLASTAFATVPALEAGDILLFGIIVLLTGFCLGADLALPPAMQADVAEYEYFRKGRDRTGIMFAAEYVDQAGIGRVSGHCSPDARLAGNPRARQYRKIRFDDPRADLRRSTRRTKNERYLIDLGISSR